MMLIRPVSMEDLPVLYDFSRKTGGGMTSLPAHEDALATRIQWSLDSFAKDVTEPGLEYYLMVLEKAGQVVGCTGVFATVGLKDPFYSYHLLHLTQVSRRPAKTVHTKMLQLVNDFTGATELGTLFLSPDHRGGGAGMLLSKCRYLLIAAHRHRFADRLMAEIRGWVDDQGHSPFWEAVGRHFFDMDFHQADTINAQGNQQFIADLMPKFPLYMALLPDAAQEVIGKPHDAARPAIRLLEEEGLRFANAVDIFDAGPSYAASVNQVRAVREAKRQPVRIGTPDGLAKTIVSTDSLKDLRMTLATGLCADGAVSLNDEQGQAMGLLNTSDGILWSVALRPQGEIRG